MRNWSEKASETKSKPVQKVQTPKRSHGNDELHSSAKRFLEVLPKLPSHYCRAASNRLYLEPHFETFTDIFKEYERFCKEHNLQVASRTILRSKFKLLNLFFYTPKKDQCDLCVSHKAGNVTEEEFVEHLQREEARAEKERDVQLCIQDNKSILIFADLQKVLLSSSLNASATYYKTKLCCYNYMIYDKMSHQVVCYVWNKTASELNSNSFGCMLYDYLVNRCQDKDNITIYTDGCGYQNRSSQLSNILLLFAKKYNKVVYQKYLTRGHTQMEVDSVHALIERTTRKRDICYVSLIKSAKKNAPFYEVKYLDFSFFTNFNETSFYTSIRPG